MTNITELIKTLENIKEQEDDLDCFQVYNEEPLPLEEKTIVLTMIEGINVLVFT